MNYDHQGKRFAIAGMSGTGKTTFYLKAFRNWQASYKFAFDRKREIARKLRLKTCVNVEQMKYAVLHRYPVLFDSAEMFPGKEPGALQQAAAALQVGQLSSLVQGATAAYLL